MLTDEFMKDLFIQRDNDWYLEYFPNLYLFVFYYYQMIVNSKHESICIMLLSWTLYLICGWKKIERSRRINNIIFPFYTLRYCAIMNPFSSTNWTKARGKLTVGLIWFLALSLSSVQIIHSKAVPEYFGNETFYICREIWPSPLAERTYTVAIFLITFILPMIILVYTYTCIAWKMLNHISPGNANAARDEAQLEAKMKVK